MTNVDAPEPNGALFIARSIAIQAFATLEQSLCFTFSRFAGVDAGVGALIFFKISNQRARNSIIEKLIKRKFERKYSAFWNSAFKWARVLTERRNEIVHWQLLQHREIKEGVLDLNAPPKEAKLVPPNFWWSDENTPSLEVEQLLEFEQNCEYLARNINMFNFFTSEQPNGPEAERATWQERFLQPIPYPPPENHPLFQNAGVWKNQLRS
jgi:hypothetical protein